MDDQSAVRDTIEASPSAVCSENSVAKSPRKAHAWERAGEVLRRADDGTATKCLLFATRRGENQVRMIMLKFNGMILVCSSTRTTERWDRKSFLSGEACTRLWPFTKPFMSSMTFNIASKTIKILGDLSPSKKAPRAFISRKSFAPQYFHSSFLCERDNKKKGKGVIKSFGSARRMKFSFYDFPSRLRTAPWFGIMCLQCGADCANFICSSPFFRS